MSVGAFLAIWSDVPGNQETDYLHWLTREHALERLSIDGFLRMRVFRQMRRDLCRYFIHYELASVDVLTSKAYLERLNAPTSATQRIMPILQNFARSGGRVLAAAGKGQGGTLAPIKLKPAAKGISRIELARIVAMDRVISTRLLETDVEATTLATRERQLRAGDEIVPGLLLIEGLDELAVSQAARRCNQPSDKLYTEVFQL